MNISWGVNVDLERISKSNGYGTATGHLVNSLRDLGYHIKQDDTRADVHFHFDQPQYFKAPREDMYKIIYHPWESTKLQDGWVEIMNSCDEVWATSPLIAQWYAEDGVTAPIYVLEHGVEAKLWLPKRRDPNGTVKFLHIGGEAARRGLDVTMRAFREAFADRNDVQLTIKVMPDGWNLPSFGKIRVICEDLSRDDLIQLHYDHDVFVQPSAGEGFGLSPLQAMATGMPTIILPAWAPYAKYLDPNLCVDSNLEWSQWQPVHPGNMFRPNRASLRDAMTYAADNYDAAQDFAHAQVAGIEQDYNWKLLAKQAFSDLEHRLRTK